MLLAAALPATGCSSGSSSPDAIPVISREAFVEAYVELRSASLKFPGQEISLTERDEILDRLGLTPEDLLTFVEVHGTDAELMSEIWEEVDGRFRDRRNGLDEPDGGEATRPPGGDPGRPPGG